jgi:hypothetical protein
MGCELCGGGDLWIKTYVTLGGHRQIVCDPCYEEHRSELTIFPGDGVVTERCEGCGCYGKPREVSEVSLGGCKGAYSETCGVCAEDGP